VIGFPQLCYHGITVDKLHGTKSQKASIIDTAVKVFQRRVFHPYTLLCLLAKPHAVRRAMSSCRKMNWSLTTRRLQALSTADFKVDDSPHKKDWSL
jgi:hypothetical protein